MDAIAHTQVSGLCLVTLVVLLRAQQKMRDKKSARAAVYGAAVVCRGADDRRLWQCAGAAGRVGGSGHPLTYRLNAGGQYFVLSAGGVLLLAGVFVCGGRAGAYMDGGRPQAGAQRRTGDTAFAGAADGAGRKRLLLSGRRGAAGQHPVLGGEAGGACLSGSCLSPLQLDAEPLEAGNTQRGTEDPAAARACAGGRLFCCKAGCPGAGCCAAALR